MQLRLELVEAPASPAAVWDGLDPEQQTAAVALLARLIAKTVGPEEDDDD